VTDPLVSAARAAQQQAYAPYSRFHVGAALESEDGRVFVGCNVENASYGLTICAERAAVCAAVSAGARRFRRAVVVSDTDPPAAPCGACRQVLAEFGRDFRIDGVGSAASITWTVGELLPAAFGKEQLK
jgi:cytidine deaminase